MDKASVGNTVYLLWHTHIFEDGDENVKLLGVYSLEAKALAAQARALPLPGFCEAPEGFEICSYELDRDEWTSGYITVKSDED